MWREFKAFLLKQNILALAVAVVVGAATNRVVTAIVNDFIMPVVGVAIPGERWQSVTLDLGPAKLLVGDFMSAILHFLIVGFVAWQLTKLFIKPDPGQPTKQCPFCKMQIDATSSRCAHCTSQLAAA